MCEDHFLPTSFTADGKRLKRDAVPKLYESEKMITSLKKPTKTYTRTDDPQPSTSRETPRQTSWQITLSTSSDEEAEAVVTPSTKKWLEDVVDLPTPRSKRKLFQVEEQDTPIKKKKLKGIVKRQRVELNSKRTGMSRLKRKLNLAIATSSLQNVLASATYPSNQSKAIVNMQLIHKRRSKWLKTEKELALGLYYKSPTAYRYLLRQNIILPALSTIRGWICCTKFLPGISSKLFEQITMKVKDMTADEKACILCFDGMALRKHLEYSKIIDQIEGFEDSGIFGRTNKFAKEVLVFMVRGLYSRWKLPVSYFVSGSATQTEKLRSIILLNISELGKTGLLVKGVVCDQGTNNVSALKGLGVTPLQPFFLHESKKYHVFF